MDNIGKIRNTVSLELARAFKVSDLQARSEMCSELIQCLATGLALAITQGCGGHPQGVSDMLDGTTNFIHEEAARYMPLAQAMARPGNT